MRMLLLPAKVLATCLGLVALLALAGWLLRPDRAPPARDADELREIAASRDVGFDPAALPVVQCGPAEGVDYADGEAGAWWPRGQSPVLDAVVDGGDLPPVAERVGPEPLVLRGCDGLGTYGGTWHRVATSKGDTHVIFWRMAGATPVRWSPLGRPIRPHLARALEEEDGGRVFVLRLRRGMRWSDGHPFTAADVLFWWRVLTEGESTKAFPSLMRIGDAKGRVEKVDDHTVRYVFPEPNGLFRMRMAKFWNWAMPRHYLEPRHPDFGDEALIAAEMAKRKHNDPIGLWKELTGHLNPECPRIWPWIYRRHTPNKPFIFVRNPYFCAVDPEGRQLPYIDQVLFDVKQKEFVPIAASDGALSMQLRHIEQKDYTLLMKGRANGYRVFHWFPATRSPFTIFPNLNRNYVDYEAETVDLDAAASRLGTVLHRPLIAAADAVIAERGATLTGEHLERARAAGLEGVTLRTAAVVDPVAKAKAELLADKRFRHALSLAIDRQAIIDVEFNDQTEPSQIEPGPGSGFHHPALGRAAVAHDPERANALLDAIGLPWPEGAAHRTLPDGTPLTFYVNMTSDYLSAIGIPQLVIRDWKAVGIRAILRDKSRQLFEIEYRALAHDFSCWTGESEFYPLMEMRNFVPTNSWSLFAPGYGTWYQRGGLYGDPEALASPAAVAPPPGHPARRAMELYEAAGATTDPDEQRALVREILDINAEELWTISICTPPPQPVIVADELRNVPENGLVGAGFYTPANTGIETYCFAPGSGEHSEGTLRDLRAQMRGVYTRYGEIPVPPDGRGMPATAAVGAAVGGTAAGDTGPAPPSYLWTAVLPTYAVYVLIAAAVALACVFKPYIGRRLLIMIPTLLVISVVVFTVIQLPPGDYLTSKIAELELKGDDAALQEVKSLQRMFNTDESQPERYLRWLGASWFVDPEPGNEGLLQGNLGRSMQDGQPVNEMVGDRIVLTLTIASFSIVFTWLLALAIGILSAVKQYSPTDYFFTLLGFVGMSIPPFLLALILIHVFNVAFGIKATGLHSAHYLEQTELTWAKFGDLLLHLLIPVAILGLVETAGMIRIMRGNLLDELNKPYVTTARAKGVRPLKLLLKYPVRIALNPFISTIGLIFPQLLSRGAIVAIVLSLPTVGPLLLDAIRLEDMYLAGSMLMVLALLGVLGTLVSDLLLLWLDPRIRLEGGRTR